VKKVFACAVDTSAKYVVTATNNLTRAPRALLVIIFEVMSFSIRINELMNCLLLYIMCIDYWGRDWRQRLPGSFAIGHFDNFYSL